MLKGKQKKHDKNSLARAMKSTWYDRFLGLLVLKIFRQPFAFLLYPLKSFIKSRPELYNFFKRRFYIAQVLYEQNATYKQMLFNDFKIFFESQSLRDQRGIGRMARSYFDELKKKEEYIPLYSYQRILNFMSNKKKSIYFFPSIHWCPRHLPPNSIVMIHDVTPLLFPDAGYYKETLVQWRTHFKQVAQDADHLITISHSSAKDIAIQLDVPLDKIFVNYNGVTALPQSRNVRLPQNDYVVFLGAHDHNKNLQVVLEALRCDVISSVDLVMLGDNVSVKKMVCDAGLKDRAHFLGGVSDAVVGTVLKNALCLVFPSLYEGFGQPPMEAALHGTPSICSDRPAMNEILTDVALFLPPHDSLAWAHGIMRYKNNKLFRTQIGKKAQEKVKALTWSASVSRFYDYVSKKYHEEA